MTTPTRRERAERLQAYRLELVSRIVDDLAHEIRNPLHALVINVEVLKRRIAAGASDSALERTAVIEEELQRVHGTVDRLIRLLRPNGDSARVVGVALVLDEIGPLLTLQARVARRSFEIELADPNACVAVAPDSLRYAILALAELLLDRLDDGGTLRITAANDGAHHVIEITGDRIAGREDDNGGEQEALAFANALLDDAGGAALSAAGDTPASFSLRVPRAGTA